LARARSSESRLAWALVRCALHGRCDDRVVEEHGDLLDALSELQASFPDKPAEWFYRAVYRLLAGKVEKVGNEHWLVKGLAELGDTYPWYNVWISGGRYRCDYFFRAYGYVRKARICSHIATVMLYKAAEVACRVSLKATSPASSFMKLTCLCEISRYVQQCFI